MTSSPVKPQFLCPEKGIKKPLPGRERPGINVMPTHKARPRVCGKCRSVTTVLEITFVSLKQPHTTNQESETQTEDDGQSKVTYTASQWGSLVVIEDFCPVNHPFPWMPAQNSREGGSYLQGRVQGSREHLLEMGTFHAESYSPWATQPLQLSPYRKALSSLPFKG